MSEKQSNNFLCQLCLSLFTPTVIISKISADSVMDFLEEIGKASEEIFRGERLPILKDHYNDENL